MKSKWSLYKVSATVGSGLWGAAAPRPARRSHVISSLNSRLRFRLVRLLSLVQLYLTTGSEVERRLSTHKTRRLVWAALPLRTGLWGWDDGRDYPHDSDGAWSY